MWKQQGLRNGGEPSLTAEYMQASELRELHLFDK